MITLNFNNTNIDIKASDSSYRYRSLMSKPQLVLKFSLPKYIEFQIGTWCEYQGERYTLNKPQDIKKNGTRNIEYTLLMGGEEDKMSIYKMRNSVDHRLKWSMCAKPHEFVEEIVKNLNERMGENVWSVGTCIEHTEKTVEFNHTYIDSALQSIADAFETEWEIVNHTISLRKVEYFKDTPLPLSYGKGNGFVPGIGRTTASNEQPIKRLYIQGGERNIDRSKYGSAELLLPRGQTYDYEGRTYKADADGYYIERIDKISDAVKEDSLDCSEIYPSRVGKVSSIEVVNAEKNFYDIIDNTIPEALNFNDYIIKGNNMTIIFQSGMLSSKEFELKYKHAERRFEIVPQEIDGVTMPNDTWKPQVGDEYAVFGCMLPDSYICDNTTKTGASWDMFKEGAKYLYEHEEQKFTFTGTLQGLYAKRNWENIGGRLKVGSYIHFSDEQFANEGIDIRITGVKDFLNTPHSPVLELSNSVSGKTVNSQLREIDNQEIVINDTKKSIIEYTKRRFRDAKETLGMLNDSLLNFSQSVNPVTVQTMAALIGDESLQFRFVKSKTNFTQTDLQILYNKNTKQLIVSSASYLQHMTLGINAISSTHVNSNYKVWKINKYTSAVLDDASKKYYLYAKVSHDTANVGDFLLSETAIDMVAESGYYYFFVGILNSEIEGERSYVSLYGFTEILPGRITTDRIVSGNGESYFDMVANSMKLGDALDFNSEGDGRLLLKGTLVQSQSGATEYIGCYRGVYDNNTIYYRGDIVVYENGGAIATYRYINPSPSKGREPLEVSHWQVLAVGKNGVDGKSVNIRGTAVSHVVNIADLPALGMFITVQYLVDETKDVKKWNGRLWTSVSVSEGDGYITADNGHLWVLGENGWADCGQIKGDKGDKGDKGESPAMVYRGEYDNDATYYGTQARTDVVKYNEVYYIARVGVGEFNGINPSDGVFWGNFGAQFDSVATNLLLADGANIAGWVFRNGILYSQNNTCYLDGRNGDVVLKGNFVGSGRFVGNDGQYKFDVNADERKFSIYGPDFVKSESLEAGDGSSPFEYFEIGNFRYVGTGSDGRARMCLQLKIKMPEQICERYVTLDPHMGLSFVVKNKLDDTEVSTKIFNGGLLIGGHAIVVFDDLPTKDEINFLVKGQVYRDGNTLKIKTS